MIVIGCEANLYITGYAGGHIVYRDERHNVVTTAFRDLIRDFVFGAAVAGGATTPTAPSSLGLNFGNVTGQEPLGHIQLGTSNVPATAADTGLKGTVVYDRPVLSVTKGANSLTITQGVTTAQANGVVLYEAGLFTADTPRVLIARAAFNAIDRTGPTTPGPYYQVAFNFIWFLTWTVPS